MGGGIKKKSGQRRGGGSKAQPTVAFRTGNSSDNATRVAPDGTKGGPGSNFRSAATIRRLQMYKGKPDLEKMRKQPLKPTRIAPDRRWFGNTRVITQDKLSEFREAMLKSTNDPYSVVLKRSKLPLSLFSEPKDGKESRMKLLGIQTFSETFGRNSTRKRPRLNTLELSDVMSNIEKATEKYGEGDNDKSLTREDDGSRDEVMAEIFKKGASRRIWQELYKVVDSSDVLVQVVDARDPMGTRCKHLETYLKKDRPHKHMVLLFNKCDLIPSWATARWVKILSRDMPTVAFHASITNPFGKNSLISLLRQYASLMKDKQHMSVGFIGYPNVGKSSVINTLKMKKVCSAAPVPGETRVWQYVSLTNRVHLIDCPGIVPSDPDAKDEGDKILRGVVRAERVENPEDYIDKLLAKVKKSYIIKKYKFDESTTWENAEEFLTLLAKRSGKLRKGGEPDISIAARMVIYDWQRGRIPFFEPPPYAYTMAPGYVPPVEDNNDADDEEQPEEQDDDAGDDNDNDDDADDDNDTTGAKEPVTREAAKRLVRVTQEFCKITCALTFDDVDKEENVVEAPTATTTKDLVAKRKAEEEAAKEEAKKKRAKRIAAAKARQQRDGVKRAQGGRQHNAAKRRRLAEEATEAPTAVESAEHVDTSASGEKNVEGKTETDGTVAKSKAGVGVEEHDTAGGAVGMVKKVVAGKKFTTAKAKSALRVDWDKLAADFC